MSFYVTLFVSIGSIFLFMAIMFFVALSKKNNGIIDICWSLNFILPTLISFIWSAIEYKAVYINQLLATILILIWGIRLSYHVGQRNIGKPEDRRYAELRENWAKNFNLQAFFKIFMLQALWAAIIVAPVIVMNSFGAPSTYGFIYYDPTNWAYYLIPASIGLVVWVIGFYFEAIGDRQLKQFIKNPENKGKVIEIGLWKYTRHPNFFGEMTMSWGLFIITLTFALDSTSWPLVFFIFSPLIYTLLIRFVTGVPRLENYLITKPGYKEYMERTSMIFPWFPKKKNIDEE